MNTWASFYYHIECRLFCLLWASIAEEDSFEWLHRRISSKLKSWNHLVQHNKQHMSTWKVHFSGLHILEAYLNPRLNRKQHLTSTTLQTITVPQESTTQKYHRISSIDPERRYLNFSTGDGPLEITGDGVRIFLHTKFFHKPNVYSINFFSGARALHMSWTKTYCYSNSDKQLHLNASNTFCYFISVWTHNYTDNDCWKFPFFYMVQKKSLI